MTNKLYLEAVSLCITVSIAAFIVYVFIALYVAVFAAIYSFLPELYNGSTETVLRNGQWNNLKPFPLGPRISFPIFGLIISFLSMILCVVLAIPAILLDEIIKENQFKDNATVNWKRDGF